MKIKELKIGDWFIYGSSLYLRIDIRTTNCLEFTVNGKIVDVKHFNSQTEITPINVSFQLT